MTAGPGQFAERCPACGATPLRIVWVHGHGQCARCGCNVAPCCQPDERDVVESEPAREEQERRPDQGEGREREERA